MGFFGYFRKGYQLALLKGEVAEEVASDPGAFVPALVIYALPALIAGLLLAVIASVIPDAVLFGGSTKEVQPALLSVMHLVRPLMYGAVFFLVFAALVGSLVYVGILHLVAKLFKGEAAFLDYYQTMGIGSLVTLGGFIPFIGALFSIWAIVVFVVVTARVQKLSTGKAVAVVLIPYLLIIALAAAVVLAFLAAFSGMAGTPGMPGIPSSGPFQH